MFLLYLFVFVGMVWLATYVTILALCMNFYFMLLSNLAHQFVNLFIRGILEIVYGLMMCRIRLLDLVVQ